MLCGWKVTVGLASHWPCITDSVVYPPTGSTANVSKMNTPPMLLMGHDLVYLWLGLCVTYTLYSKRQILHRCRHILNLWWQFIQRFLQWCNFFLPLLLFLISKETNTKGTQFSVGCGISSQATEFALFHGILIFPRNFAEAEKWKTMSTIFGSMMQFHHRMWQHNSN